MQKPFPDDRPIGIREVARLLGISPQAVQNMHRHSIRPNYRGDFPRAAFMEPDGSRPMWWRSAILEYKKRREKGGARTMPRERTEMLKVTPEGGVTLAHPGATPGPLESGGYIVAVDHVPMHVSAANVITAYRNTAVYHTPGGGYRVRYDDLGPGKVVRS